MGDLIVLARFFMGSFDTLVIVERAVPFVAFGSHETLLLADGVAKMFTKGSVWRIYMTVDRQ